MIRIAVVGAGLIGKERLGAICRLAEKGMPVALNGVFDVDTALCRKVAGDYNSKQYLSLRDLLRDSPDWVFLALPHDHAVEVTMQALDTGANVLVEKPLGRDVTEADKLLRLGGDRLRVGMNYRFYPGIARAIQDIRNGRFGELINIDFLLGHGGAPGQENSWKLHDERAGGGCLIDPGVHLLDLCMQITQDQIKCVGGASWKGFWKTGVEEDVTLLLSTGRFSISLHVSIIHWRSVFCMSINGTDGYGIVSGRNRSYGKQSYVVGPRWGWQHAKSQALSETVEVETDGMDVFEREIQALLFPENLDPDAPHPSTADEALAVMRLLDHIRDQLGLRRQYAVDPIIT